MVFKAGEGQGKSGSFFFFSHDKQFLIKTMTDSELETFNAMFKSFYTHLIQNPDSLLARIYGIFTVKMEDIAPVHLILMGNTVQA
jgi:1-phosphatidylinositol-4-phosphate 5-kinase